MKNNKIVIVNFLAAGFLLLSGFLLAGNVRAQEEAPAAGEAQAQETAAPEEATAVPQEVQQALEEAAEKSLAEEEKPEEIKADTEIKPEDLGAKKATILPDNPLYGFKNLFRRVRPVFTRDPIKRAELQLQYASQKLAEVQQLVEEKGTAQAQEIAARVIGSANQDLDRIARRGEDLKAQGKAEADKFLDKIAEHSLKQQLIIQKLEEQAPEQAMARIEEARQRHLEKFGQVMTKIAEKPEELALRLPQIVERQRGSDFKELKAVEILRDLEGQAPENMRPALQKAQTTLGQRLEERLIQMPEEVRQEKLQKYVKFMPGNAVRQFEAFDRMRQSFQRPEMVREMELAKDKAVQKIETQLAKLPEESRAQFMAPWQDGDPEDLRTMTEVEMRMGAPESFQPIFQEAQDNFRDRFMDNPEALRQNPVFQKMASQPDVVDLKLSQDLVEVFRGPAPEILGAPSGAPPGAPGAPEKGAPMPPPPAFNFVKEFQNQAAQKFVENVEKGTVTFVGPPVPAGLKVLEEIKTQVPPQARRGIDRAIAVQTQTVERQLERIDDPAVFERYKEQIEGDRIIKEKVEKFGPPTFFGQLERKEREIQLIQQEEEGRKLEKMEEINRQIFQAPPGEEGLKTKEQILKMIRPEARREIEEFRKAMPPKPRPGLIEPGQEGAGPAERIMKPEGEIQKTGPEAFPTKPEQFQQRREQPFKPQQPFQQREPSQKPEQQFEQRQQFPQQEKLPQQQPQPQQKPGGLQEPGGFQQFRLPEIKPQLQQPTSGFQKPAESGFQQPSIQPQGGFQQADTSFQPQQSPGGFQQPTTSFQPQTQSPPPMPPPAGF